MAFRPLTALAAVALSTCAALAPAQQTVTPEQARAAWATVNAFLGTPAPVSPVVAPVPLPTPSPTPKAEPTAVADIYAGGTKYPDAAYVDLKDFDVPVGAQQIHVPVSIHMPTPNTIMAKVRVFNGAKGRADPDTVKTAIFRPGDPLTQSLPFNVYGMDEGNEVQVILPNAPDGAAGAGQNWKHATARKGATNAPIPFAGRAPLTFSPQGTLAYQADGKSIAFDDNGGKGTWSTALHHGRIQPGNGETGYYGEVSRGGFERRGDTLAFKTRKLDQPIGVGSPATMYPFLAVNLSAHNSPDLMFTYWSIEWEAKMPDRKGAWPALWLVGADGWPPEIDVYEGFTYGEWDAAANLSTNLHGGRWNNRTFTRGAMRMRMSDFGLPNTVNSDFHKFQVTVTPEWITMFVDGRETMQYANPFAGTKWYPIMNVGVKIPANDNYDKGSAEMLVRSVKIWRQQ